MHTNTRRRDVRSADFQTRRPSARRLLGLARMGRNAAQSRVAPKGVRALREVEIPAGTERYGGRLRDAEPKRAGDIDYGGMPQVRNAI